MDTAKNNVKSIMNLDDAVKHIKESSKVKFDATVDLDIILNLTEKQKKESIKGSVSLPNTFGKDKQIIVFCDEKDAKAAKAAGAIEAGLDELKEKVLKNEITFDTVIATPFAMPKIVQLGKVLGPRGLMPNPKDGTVTTEVEATIKSFSAGKMNFKMNQEQGTIKAKVGKVSMDIEKIKENIIAFMKAVQVETRKLGATPFKKIYVKTTMGPSVKLDLSGIIA